MVVFVVWMVGSFVVHGVLLGEGYAQLPNLARAMEDQERYFPLMLLAHVSLSGAFVWIYLRGRDDKPWHIQGLRYGVAIALLAPIPTYMIYYVVQPWPGGHVIKQIVFDSILVLILGCVTAFLHKGESGANDP